MEEFAETAKAGDSYRIFTSAPLASYSLGEIVSEESISNGNIEEGGTGKGIERKERECLVLVRTIFFFSLLTPLSEYSTKVRSSFHPVSSIPVHPFVRLSSFCDSSIFFLPTETPAPETFLLCFLRRILARPFPCRFLILVPVCVCVCVCVCVYRVTRKHRRQHKIMGQWVSITQSENNENLNL